MSIFSRLFARKESATGHAVSAAYVGRATWTPRQYDKLSYEGFQKNVIAYKSVSTIARGVARVPWTLMDGDKEIDEHPILDLLHKPNPIQGGAALFEALVAYRLLSGNGYLEAVSGSDVPVELWALRPDRMKVVPGPNGIAGGYEYKVGGQPAVTWECDPLTGQGPVLHWKSFNPLSDWYGQSPLEAAAFAIDQHNEAGEWNKALLENSGRPSGLLTYAPKDGPTKLAADQFARLKQQMDDQYAGASKAGKLMLLDGGMAWTSMSLSPIDMDFLSGKDSSARDIAQAFGVPPQLLGIKGDSTYNNQAEAREAMWQDTIIPLLDDLCDSLNNWLVPMFGRDSLRVGFDLDEVPALAPSRQAKWTAVSTATFLTTNEKRVATGYEELPIPEADEILIATTSTPLAAAVQSAQAGAELAKNPPPAPVPGAPGDNADGMAKSLRAQGMSAEAAAEISRLAYGA